MGIENQELDTRCCEVCNYEDAQPFITDKKITTKRQHVLCRVCSKTYAGNLSHNPSVYENPDNLINTSLATHVILDEQEKRIAELSSKIDKLQETIEEMYRFIGTLRKA